MRIFVIAALALSFAACSSGLGNNQSTDDAEVKGSISVDRGLPHGVGQPDSASMGVGIDEDLNLFFVSFGSSSNPYRVTEATLEGREVDLDIENEANKPATTDFVPTTSTMTFAGGLPADGTLTVDMDDFGTVELQVKSGAVVWLDSE